jgi:hypothetical protein
MTTSDQEEQAERRLVQRNDQRAREQAQQGTTFKAFADADTHIPGRFEAVSAAHVVASTETPKYPAPSTPFQRDPVGIEPPTGYDINAMPDPENPTGVFSISPPAATDDPAHAPSGGSGPAPSGGLMSERAGSSPSSETESEVWRPGSTWGASKQTSSTKLK